MIRLVGCTLFGCALFGCAEHHRVEGPRDFADVGPSDATADAIRDVPVDRGTLDIGVMGDPPCVFGPAVCLPSTNDPECPAFSPDVGQRCTSGISCTYCPDGDVRNNGTAFDCVRRSFSEPIGFACTVE